MVKRKDIGQGNPPGHGSGALGPSDSSDSGSDIAGAPGLGKDVGEDLGLGMDRGTTSDPDGGAPAGAAGPDVGDADLDSDSDAAGTGERASAGRDSTDPANRDRDTDRIERLPETEREGDDASGAPAADDRRMYKRGGRRARPGPSSS